MPPAPSLPTNHAIARQAGAECSREVIVDLPPVIALLPGEVDLIVSALGEALIKLFSGEDKIAAEQHGHQLQDERT